MRKWLGFNDKAAFVSKGKLRKKKQQQNVTIKLTNDYVVLYLYTCIYTAKSIIRCRHVEARCGEFSVECHNSFFSARVTRFNVALLHAFHLFDLVSEPFFELEYFDGLLVTDDESVVGVGERNATRQIREGKPIQVGNGKFLEILFIICPYHDVSGKGVNKGEEE